MPWYNDSTFPERQGCLTDFEVVESCTVKAIRQVLGRESLPDDRPRPRKSGWRQFWDDVLCESDREDAGQEVRLAVLEALGSYDPSKTSGPVQTHAIERGKYRLRDWLNAELKRRNWGDVSDDCLDDHADGGDGELSRMCSGELATMASAASRFLPGDMARAVNLRFGLDSRVPMTHSEIADELGVSVSHAWDLVREGIARLRAELRVNEILESEAE